MLRVNLVLLIIREKNGSELYDNESIVRFSY